MSSASPAQTAWFYPIRGMLFLLRNPPKSLTNALRHPLSSGTSLLPTLLKSLVVTLVVIYTGYKTVDGLLLTSGLSSSLPLPSWLRKLSVLLGVVVLVGFVGGEVIGGRVRGMAKGFGKSVLIEQLPPVVGQTVEKIDREDENEDGEEKKVDGNTTEGGDKLTTGLNEGLGGVLGGVKSGAKSGEKAVQSVPDKMKNTVKDHTTFYLVNRFMVAPLTAFIPVIGPVIFAGMTSKSTGESYILPYTTELDKAQQYNPTAALTGKSTTSSADESFPTVIRSFGLVAGILTALPIIGPIFHFSNYVGAALLVADIQKHQLTGPVKSGKSTLKAASSMIPGSGGCGDKKLF